MKNSWLPGLCLCLLPLISSCNIFPGVYKLEIQQGNIIEQEMIDSLKPGMTRRQVRYIMGTPLVVDSFNPDRWDYYYSIRTSENEFREERVSLLFEGDELVGFSGDYLPGSVNPEQTGDAEALPEVPEGVQVGDPHDVDAPAKAEKKPWWKW